MKRMYSEEELQDLIKEQGGSGGSTLDDIVDSKGNKRFIEGNGTPYTEDVPGMTASSTKWTLNGEDLILEFAGSFTQDVTGQTQLAMYEMPQWIANKITTLREISGMGIVSPLSFNVATTETSVDVKVMLLKVQNYLSFALINNLSVASFNGEPAFFRFICHLTIDSK